MQIQAVLQQFRLPITTDFPCDDLYAATLSDKKRSSGTVSLIVPKAIGNCQILPTPVEDLKTFIKEGL